MGPIGDSTPLSSLSIPDTHNYMTGKLENRLLQGQNTPLAQELTGGLRPSRTCFADTQAPREEDIEKLAADLIKAMTRALDEVAPKALGKGTGKNRWNSQCTDAVREMRLAWRRAEKNSFLNTIFDVYEAKRKLFQAKIQTAKREIWGQTIENMTEAVDLFRMVNRLGKPSSAGGLPLLSQDGVTRRTLRKKAEVLLDTHTQPVEDWMGAEKEASPRARSPGEANLGRSQGRSFPRRKRGAWRGRHTKHSLEAGMADFWTVHSQALQLLPGSRMPPKSFQVCNDGSDSETTERQDTTKELLAELAPLNSWEGP
ncbi:hypothetical protein CFIMG_007561RA00001 [Ceratocystis fimbriata CBS 114723]|uniref:Uncharacterized protein n=1 Tax=Ceratocystis fimbriata CBS 114723 TaxID=1035309 RepID=A0A2C5WWE0_9PEZI|nr:hypothetical protein CFIMG_007561RA00001 [Ceratocystis fimbriata CBS 114723]